MNRKKDVKLSKGRLNILSIGNILLIIFLISVTLLSIWYIKTIVDIGFKEAFLENWGKLLLIYIVELIIFWAGIIMVYATSVQLGIKHRVIGLICGIIPIAHIIALISIIYITGNEAIFEKRKLRLDLERQAQEICKTRYPILMVHGVFFRDFKYFNYWGRVPDELIRNGATIYYGNHESAASVRDCAKELADRIRQIVEETGCEKVNVIAHSKGGLDTKTAIALEGIAPMVASLTTINTPHRGCEFAEYLLGKAPAGLKDKVSSAYNTALARLGDKNPDFITAVTDLTASSCRALADEVDGFDYKKAGIYTQSVGSCMKKATSGAFPLNMSYHLVDYFDGPNDGLVGEGSFRWGENYTFLQNKKKRGISHGDMIDLNRANIPGFDIREFYVQLVSRLRDRGL